MEYYHGPFEFMKINVSLLFFSLLCFSRLLSYSVLLFSSPTLFSSPLLLFPPLLLFSSSTLLQLWQSLCNSRALPPHDRSSSHLQRRNYGEFTSCPLCILFCHFLFPPPCTLSLPVPAPLHPVTVAGASLHTTMTLTQLVKIKTDEQT